MPNKVIAILVKMADWDEECYDSGTDFSQPKLPLC